MKSKIKQTERGWAGHFICSYKCQFRRNTLLEYKNKKIVVSTVGLMKDENFKIEQIGSNRYFETMAFWVDEKDKKFYDADVTKQINFDSEWSISEIDKENEANIMHENVVKEIKKLLIRKLL